MTICSESDVFTNKADDGAWCQALVRGLEGYTLCVKWDGTRLVTGAQLKAAVVHRDTNNIDFVRIVSCGHEIYDASILEADKYGHLPPCQAILRVLGGKGGFGSLLRGAGKGKNVSDNNDACRDLSGRRLRHVNAEKKLQEWKEDSKERDLEVVARQFIKKQKIHEKEVEQKQAALVEVANESAERLRGVAQSVRSGLRQEKSLLQVASAKRSAEQEEGAQPGPSKRPTFMWGLDDDVNSEEDSDTDGELDRAGHVDETLSENPIKIALAPSTPPPGSQNGAQDNKICLKNRSVGTLDLKTITSASQLEDLGMERLKEELAHYGLKCGGTLQERSTRLYLLNNNSVQSLDPKHMIKSKKK
eukprot:CAMPEP_0196576196 /NCGR_PEP_ID=MMETSP1081-20130531/5520_1 /TAXON_ID=36882 /ORGANISM="Pyramimonas amylifera, Strain CCMP720" /LENGTH=359 /DNA_ID=CAMNT_0041894741 /DNA_START=37 /DNA_END=1116 /DNA_ORIENTATION=-